MSKIRFLKSIEIEIDTKVELDRLNNAYSDIPVLRDLLIDVTEKTFSGELESAVEARRNAEKSWNAYRLENSSDPIMEDYYSPFAQYLHEDVCDILGDVFSKMNIKAEYENKNKPFDRDRVAKIVPQYELIKKPEPSKSPKI